MASDDGAAVLDAGSMLPAHMLLLRLWSCMQYWAWRWLMARDWGSGYNRITRHNCIISARVTGCRRLTVVTARDMMVLGLGAASSSAFCCPLLIMAAPAGSRLSLTAVALLKSSTSEAAFTILRGGVQASGVSATSHRSLQQAVT